MPDVTCGIVGLLKLLVPVHDASASAAAQISRRVVGELDVRIIKGTSISQYGGKSEENLKDKTVATPPNRKQRVTVNCGQPSARRRHGVKRVEAGGKYRGSLRLSDGDRSLAY